MWHTNKVFTFNIVAMPERNGWDRTFWMVKIHTRMLLPWLPQVLSCRHGQSSQRFDHTRTVRKDASENDILDTTRLASGGNVGMRISRFSSTEQVGQNVSLKDIVDPLNPRDAFYGGRVNATKLLVKTEANPSTTKIKYVNFTSLYPDIDKNGVYPVGHPTIFTENIHPDPTRYFGLIQCDVLAPRGLYHPVLPFKCHNKLMFALCRTCSQDGQQLSICHHVDEQRIFTGTWVSLELDLAVEMGYKVVKIHEVWHFQDKTNWLFRGYIDMFLKKKQKASWWPGWCQTDEDKLCKERYFQE